MSKSFKMKFFFFAIVFKVAFGRIIVNLVTHSWESLGPLEYHTFFEECTNVEDVGGVLTHHRADLMLVHSF